MVSVTGFSFASYHGIGECPCSTSALSSTSSHGGLPPLTLLLSSPAALAMWTKPLSKLLLPRCPRRLAAPSWQVWQPLWFCRFPVPLSSELPSGVSAEHCRGTRAWDSLPSAAGDRSWQPRQAQQKVASGPRDAWRGACGGLPAACEQRLGWHSFNSSWIFRFPQECCLGLGQGEGGKSQTHLQSWHIICGMLCLILPLKANPSQKDPTDICWGQF